MKVTNLAIEGLKLIELSVFRDERGFFVERFNSETYQKMGLPQIYFQDNQSRSFPNVLRGLHLQYDRPQAKLVGVTHGKIWDVAVDLRPKSPTFGKHVGLELTGDMMKFFFIPAGFAHGFCVLGNEPADVVYKVDNFYNSKGETGIKWDDPDLNIPWPTKNPIVSARDSALSSLTDYKQKFVS